MSSIIAIGITYALVATEDHMYKGPRRAAQLCCTRAIFTAIAPRSIEKLLNTKRTLSLVACSDGFPYIRECGFYNDGDDEFCIGILKRVFFLQRVFFSKGCKLSVKLADYLLTVRSLENVSLYVEDEHFPVEAAVKLLRDHPNESVRASIANTIVVHEQDSRGNNTRTVIELRRLGADKILFDLILEKRVHEDVENLGKYAAALGALMLSFCPSQHTAQNLPESVLADTNLMEKINKKEESWTIGLTPKYALENLVPAFCYLVRCRDSAAVRGSGSLMLASATARGELSNICDAIYTPEFFREEMIPILQRLTPLSPEETVAQQHPMMGMRSFSATREQVITTTTTDSATHQDDDALDNDSSLMDNTETTRTTTSYSCTNAEEGTTLIDDLKKRNHIKSSTTSEIFVSVVPSAEEKEYAQELFKKQQELSYFSWVLQNFANSENSRRLFLSETSLQHVNPFLNVFPKPKPATQKVSSKIDDYDCNNTNKEDSSDDEEEQDAEILGKEDVAYLFGKNANYRADLVAYNYSIEARHRISDAIRFCCGQERSVKMIAAATAQRQQMLTATMSSSNQQQQVVSQAVLARDQLALLHIKILDAGTVDLLLENVAAGPANFRSQETYLELVSFVCRFVPSVLLSNFALPISPLTAEEENLNMMLLTKTKMLKVFVDLLLRGSKYWNNMFYEGQFAKQHYDVEVCDWLFVDDDDSGSSSNTKQKYPLHYKITSEKKTPPGEEHVDYGEQDLDDENLDSKLSDARRKIEKQKNQLAKIKQELLYVIPYLVSVVATLVQVLQQRMQDGTLSVEEGLEIWKQNGLYKNRKNEKMKNLVFLLNDPQKEFSRGGRRGARAAELRRDLTLPSNIFSVGASANFTQRVLSAFRSIGGATTTTSAKSNKDSEEPNNERQQQDDDSITQEKKRKEKQEDYDERCDFFWNRLLFDVANQDDSLEDDDDDPRNPFYSHEARIAVQSAEKKREQFVILKDRFEKILGIFDDHRK